MTYLMFWAALIWAACGAALAGDMPDFPYPLIKVPGEKAVETWQTMRKTGAGTPVILGSAEMVADMAHRLDPKNPHALKESPSGILNRARALRHPEDLTDLLTQEAEDLQRQYPGLALLPLIPEEMIGRRPLFPNRMRGPASLLDFETGRLFDEVFIATLPVESSAQIPALLKWGGWNANPLPEYHVAALADWHARYGTELVVVGRDTLDMWVPSPPKSWPEAMDLAKEMFLYNSDIVTQGFGTIAPLAGSLQASAWWTFWWD